MRDARPPHPSGFVLPDRGDGLHWLRCIACGREWAEKDSGAFVKGARACRGYGIPGDFDRRVLSLRGDTDAGA